MPRCLRLLWLLLLLSLPLTLSAQTTRHTLMREDVGLVHPLAYGTTLSATTLNAAITAQSTTVKTLFLSCGTWTLASDVTTPRTLTLYIPACAAVVVNTGVTLTLNGPYHAEEPVWHSGAGTVTLGTLTGTGMDNTHGRADDALREGRYALGDVTAPFLTSGCAPAVPSSSLTLDAFACTGYVPGSSTDLLYVLQTSSTVGPLSGGDGTYWLALHKDTSSTVSGWTRHSSTHYLWKLASTQPSDPSGAVVFGTITVEADVITATQRMGVMGGRRLDVTRPPYSVPHNGTGNAATGINQALLDASSGYGVVFLPCGTYRTTAQVLMQSSTTLMGESKDCAIIAPDTSTSIPRPVLASSVSHWTIRDLQVDCGDETVTGRQGIAALNTASYGTIERVKTYRCGQYGVLLHGDTSSAPYSSGGQGMVLRDSVIDMGDVPTGACTGLIAVEYLPKGPVGFLAEPGPLITGNIVIAEEADAGIKLNNARGARIIGNSVSGARCSSATGAIIDAPGNANTVIQGNAVYNTRLGVTFGGLPRSNATGGNELRTTGTRILGNVIDTYTEAGMFSSDGATDITIQGNYVVVNGGTTTGHGLDFQPQPVASSGFSYTRLTITDNTFVGNQLGLYLQESSDSAYGYVDLRVTGNTLSSSLSTGQAIAITQAPYAVVTHNSIRGHRNAINLSAGSHFVDLSHNTAVDTNSANSATQPCYAIAGTDPRIVGNTCVNSSGSYHAKFGLSLNNTQRALIAGNVFNGMDTGDITLAGTAMTAATPLPQALYVKQAATSVGAVTTETTVSTLTLPAAYFTLFGGVSITAFGETDGNAGVKTLRLYFGGTQVGANLSVAASVSASTYRLESEIVMPEVNVTTQHAFLKAYDLTTLEQSSYNGMSINTTSGTVEVKVTCQKADAADVCRSRGLLVKPWR